MNQSIHDKVTNYLKAHHLMTLSTLTDDGKPMSHPVDYVSDGHTVFFCTMIDTRKAQNIQRNPNVAYTITEYLDDWAENQGIQMQGKAFLLTDPDQIENIRMAYLDKFPQMQEMPEEFVTNRKIFKIEPLECKFIDNTVAWGHFDVIRY